MKHVIAWLVLAGCGLDPVPLPPRNATAADPDADAAPMVADAPAFARPGEQMIFRLALRDFELATVAIVVGDAVELGGRRAAVVQRGVQGSPLVQLVHRVDSNFSSWIDAETSRPLLFRAAEQASADDRAFEGTEFVLGEITA